MPEGANHWQAWLSDKEAARVFNVSVRTVKRWRKGGILPYRKLGGRVLIPANAVHAPTDREVVKVSA
jgi:excisionase family DNA binding protein